MLADEAERRARNNPRLYSDRALGEAQGYAQALRLAARDLERWQRRQRRIQIEKAKGAE
jgi:hypothetical protein